MVADILMFLFKVLWLGEVGGRKEVQYGLSNHASFRRLFEFSPFFWHAIFGKLH